MFLLGTAKLRYLIKYRRGGPVCPPARIKSTVVCVNCMYLILRMAHGARCVFAWWRFAFNHKLSTINY